MVTCLRGHTGLVKGLTWDPVGKYVASQADDHSLKVWRTVDWQMEANITKPFNEVQHYSRLCLVVLWELLDTVVVMFNLLISLARVCTFSCQFRHQWGFEYSLLSVCVSVRWDDPRPASVLVSRWSVPGVGSRHEQLRAHCSDCGERRLEDQYGLCGTP